MSSSVLLFTASTVSLVTGTFLCVTPSILVDDCDEPYIIENDTLFRRVLNDWTFLTENKLSVMTPYRSIRLEWPRRETQSRPEWTRRHLSMTQSNRPSADRILPESTIPNTDYQRVGNRLIESQNLRLTFSGFYPSFDIPKNSGSESWP